MTKVRQKHRVRSFHVGDGFDSPQDIREEIDNMIEVLMGRMDSPLDAGELTLMEVATAYFSRAAEITLQIQRAEAQGSVLKGSGAYKLRTGELRTFMELAKAGMELGSRRITYKRMESDQI